MIKNKRVLVTGSNGQLGKTLQKRFLKNKSFDWIFLPKEKLDIVKIDQIHQAFKKYDPKFSELIDLYPVNFVNTYISQGENNSSDEIVLRPTPKGSEQLYGKLSKNLKSEGCVKLNIGNKKIIGILALASKEREKFTAKQGVELLKFMGSVFERRISHWLN